MTAAAALVLALVVAPATILAAAPNAWSGGSATTIASAVVTATAGPDEVTVDQLAMVVGTAGSDAETSPRAVDPDTDDMVRVDDAEPGDRIVSDVVLTDDVQTIGVTWPQDAMSLDVQVRTLTDGEWSVWTAMPVSEDEVDAGSIDARHGARAGTDAFWIGDAKAVQLSLGAVDGAVPQDAALSLVGSPEMVPQQVAATSTASRSLAATTLAASTAPTVISRAAWGARAASCTLDVASRLVGAVVHHTAGSNSYGTVAQAMQQIRNDQAYHMDSRGWCDLGYNFVVDKWGNLYEGRAGSLTQAVIGVHASGYNTGTIGVSMLGTFVDVVPSDAMISSVAQIIGYRLGSYGISPLGTATYPGTGATLPAVIAHRDVAATACPGDQGYARMSRIRSLAAVVAGSRQNSAPVGFWDTTTVAGAEVTAVGWALDPDTTQPVTVRAYVDGALAGQVAANGSRPDIGTAFGLGDAHGFAIAVAATAGSHRLCLALVDVPGGGESSLTCQYVTVTQVQSVPPAARVDVRRFWSPGFGNAHFYTADDAEAAAIAAGDRNWVGEGRAFGAYASNAGSCEAGTVGVYRFYSVRYRSHFFTADQAERDTIRRTDGNWSYEGLAYCVPTAGEAESTPVYRFWSPRFGKHFYTANQAEAQTIRAGDSNWQYEGEAYSVLP